MAEMLIIAVLYKSGNLNFATAQTNVTTDVFTVVPAIYGVNNSTNEIVVIVSTDNGTLTRVLNASHLELTDPNHDSILEVSLRFVNRTIPIGQEYRACVMVASSFDLICETGHNSPSQRPETIDLVLPSYSKSSGYEPSNRTREASINK